MRNIPENKSSSDVGSVIGATLSSKVIQYREGVAKAAAEKIQDRPEPCRCRKQAGYLEIPKDPDVLTPEQELVNRSVIGTDKEWYPSRSFLKR